MTARAAAYPVYIAGSGCYLPGDPIPFDDIEKILGPLLQAPRHIQHWAERAAPVMKELLAVRSVHYAIDPKTREFTEDAVSMAVKAARQALEFAGITPDKIDLICYGSAHQDQMPTASVRIQEALGIERCDELSIHANCTSAYKALYLAHQLIAAGRNRTALALSSSISSSELRAEYYNQPLVDRESLFLRWFLCDGAGALVVTADAPQRAIRVEHTYIESIGGKRPSLMYNLRPAVWLNPAKEFEQGLHHLRQRFRNELSSGVFQDPDGSVFVNGLRRMLDQARVNAAAIRYFQVNLPSRHIIDSVIDECKTLGIQSGAFYTALDSLGYCGPPMMMICLDRILRNEPLAPGDRIASFVTEVSKFMQAGYVLKVES